MEPNAFVSEVYRRMSLRHRAERSNPSFAEIQNDSQVLLAVAEYESLLPSDKKSSILDIGFGRGWFLAACVKLGYTKLSGADFGIENKAHVADWSKGSITLHEIESDIGTFLAITRSSMTSSTCHTSSSTSQSILYSGLSTRFTPH